METIQKSDYQSKVGLFDPQQFQVSDDNVGAALDLELLN